MRMAQSDFWLMQEEVIEQECLWSCSDGCLMSSFALCWWPLTSWGWLKHSSASLGDCCQRHPVTSKCVRANGFDPWANGLHLSVLTNVRLDFGTNLWLSGSVAEVHVLPCLVTWLVVNRYHPSEIWVTGMDFINPLFKSKNKKVLLASHYSLFRCSPCRKPIVSVFPYTKLSDNRPSSGAHNVQYVLGM